MPRPSKENEDDRFKGIEQDPKFRKIKKKKQAEESEIVDERFKNAFDEEEPKRKIDKYGRKTRRNTKKYKEKVDNRLEYLSKLAKGEISGDESSSSESDEEEEVKEAEQTVENEESEQPIEETNVLALQDMDWSKVTAQDLFVLLSSFLPATGKLLKITIYLSNFGEERMKIEERYGPQIEVDSEVNGEEFEEKEVDEEKLREYEKSRLKYYFAICEFDTTATATAVYDECDTLELERSGVKISLSYVPSEMEIDRPVKDSFEATEAIKENYRPPEFILEALQKSKVEVTWDEDDDSRKYLKLWNQDGAENHEVTDKELEQFIASDNSDTELNEEEIAEKRRLLLEPEEQEEEDVDEEALIAEEMKKYEMPVVAEIAETKEDEEKPDKGFNDPFFVNPSKFSKKQKMRNKNKKEEVKHDNKDKEADLELLMLNESYGGKREDQGDDDFEADLDDKRFAVMKEDKSYGVDRTSNDYKRKLKAEKKRKGKKSKRKKLK